jgi:hypothetical protein
LVKLPDTKDAAMITAARLTISIALTAVILAIRPAPALADGTCIVNAPDGELNIRDVTSKGPGKVIDVLKNGYTITVRDTFLIEGKVWARVLDGKTKSKVVGWIYRDYLNCNVAQDAAPKPTAPASEPQVKYTDGYALIKECSIVTPKNVDEKLDLVRCRGYIRGAADTLILWQHLQPDTMPTCVPSEVRGDAMADVVLKYLHEHPEDRHLGGSVIVAYAAAATWPCPKKQEPQTFKNR